MSTETFILFLLLALIIGSLPFWAYSASWGYTPIGVLTVLLVIFLIWCNVQERPLFHRPIQQDVRSVGSDFKSLGHDFADSFRKTFR